MSTTISSENIHVKLQHNDEYRRFFFSRSCKFSDLYEKVKAVLNLKDNFIIKYKDEEGEWITISTDMELETGIVLTNGSLFRLMITLCSNDGKNLVSGNEEQPQVVDEEMKPWKRFKRDGKRCNDKPWRHRKGGRYNRNDEDVEEEGAVNGECDGGDKKKWKKERKERWRDEKDRKKKFKKQLGFENDGEGGSSSEGDSNDSLLSLEEIKKELGKLKEDLKVIKEKSDLAKGELKELKNKIREKRKNDPTDVDGFVALKKVLQEKKQSFWAVFGEVKARRNRIRRLHELAESKTV